jgi:hypothetical protein
LPEASCNAVLAEAMVRHEWLTGSGYRRSTAAASAPIARRSCSSTSPTALLQAVLAGEAFAISDMLTSRRADAQPIIGVAVPIRYGDR